MAGSDSDDLEDLLLQAGGAGKASNKRSRSEDVFADSDDEASGGDSFEVDQMPAKKAKPPGKRSKTADANKSASSTEINEDNFMFDGYGKSLIKDEADRLFLDTLTELEREMELAGRAEKRDKRLEQIRNARLYKPVQARTKQAPAAPPQVCSIKLLWHIATHLSLHAVDKRCAVQSVNLTSCDDSLCTSSAIRSASSLTTSTFITHYCTSSTLSTQRQLHRAPACIPAISQGILTNTEQASLVSTQRLLSMQAAREEQEVTESASEKADQMRSSTRLKRPDSGKTDAMAELRARRAQAQEKSTKSTKTAGRYRLLSSCFPPAMFLSHQAL